MPRKTPERTIQDAPQIIVIQRPQNLARAEIANETSRMLRPLVPDARASDQPTPMPDMAHLGTSPPLTDVTSRLTDAVRALTTAVEKLTVRLDALVGRSATSGLPSPKGADAKWTRAKTDAAVKSFVAARQSEYDELATRVLLENDEQAAARFVALFGPSALAARFGEGCRRQYVEKTPTYRAKLKPLIRRPAQFPHGWKPVVRRDSALEETIGRMRRLAQGSERA